ncbi:glucose 1-dehydrogenase [Ancylobacter sp. 3268]|uniref:SDR family NAD(P)-dependent oxidoreductase n=1 Tax=Ancylobacter sp. 3268 TaxID=2817752 RepID=UPI00285A047D|nr:SDR family oxidoreductase [Ancylobacter sp. 3268]MDR6953097.1 glucose 1-dehydrogenase [Ancylobacter sp. 3268]
MSAASDEAPARFLVTGASRGIGAAVALRLGRQHRAQLRIALAARSTSAALAEVAAELADLGAAVTTLAGDLTDAAIPARLVAEATAFCGGLDGVVANAGITGPAPLATLDPAEWDRLFAVNARAVWLLAKAAHADLAASRGAFVAVASASGIAPHPGMGAYSASKAALIMLCRQLAQEWAPAGIRVNSVSPGMIRTTLTESIYRDPQVAAERNRIVPLGRVGQAEDVAATVAFLLGPGAGFIVGQNICMDGGYTESALGRIPGRPRPA